MSIAEIDLMEESIVIRSFDLFTDRKGGLILPIRETARGQ
jgi:hypothetical protein